MWCDRSGWYTSGMRRVLVDKQRRRASKVLAWTRAARKPGPAALVRVLQSALAKRGLEVHRRASVRYGSDPLLDFERLLPRVDTMLDVGANDGQTALSFAQAFPDARVYSFEPVPSTFSALEERTSDEPNIHCFQIALGDREGDATIELAAKSGQNSLLNAAEPGPGTATVHVTTGDAWASAHEVAHIDVLKVDTEGYDLQVLEGFENLITAGRIESVLVECEFERVRPEPHTSFFEVFEYLTARGMGFTTLYTDSVFAKQLAWGNALFVRREHRAAAHPKRSEGREWRPLRPSRILTE
jgi:FkbM family methyltransferase